MLTLPVLIARPPVVNVTPSSVTASEGNSITFTCLATGVGARNFTYEWSLNGSVIKGVTEHNYSITAVSESAFGNYTCVVKNQYGGSSQSNIATLTLSMYSYINWQNLCNLSFYRTTIL